MIVIIFTIIIVLNFFLQSTILPYLSIFGIVPNTALLIIMSISLLKGKYYGAFIGLAMGLLQDIIFSQVIGVNAFIYFFAGYIIGILANKLSRDNIITPLLTSILGTLYYNFMYYIFMFFLSRNIEFIMFAKNLLVIEIMYNAIISIPIYKVFSRVFVEPTIRFNRK